MLLKNLYTQNNIIKDKYISKVSKWYIVSPLERMPIGREGRGNGFGELRRK